MKNWRSGASDVSPPIEHADTRSRWTKIGIGGSAVLIAPGPRLVPAPSVYVREPK